MVNSTGSDIRPTALAAIRPLLLSRIAALHSGISPTIHARGLMRQFEVVRSRMMAPHAAVRYANIAHVIPKLIPIPPFAYKIRSGSTSPKSCHRRSTLFSKNLSTELQTSHLFRQFTCSSTLSSRCRDRKRARSGAYQSNSVPTYRPLFS
jgi:hypothetical protein